ncbi:MAG: hemerythrin family protein [bacterium]|nr:hemerythrin family protein [bacterium]
MAVTARLLRWGRHYRLGIKQVDLQHEQLVELLNQLNAALHAGDDRSILGAKFGELTEAVAAHFQDEEQLMEQLAYDGYDSHKTEHDSLASQVLEFRRDFDAGRAELTESRMIYLSDWLRDHIIVADKRMGEFMREKQRAR